LFENLQLYGWNYEENRPYSYIKERTECRIKRENPVFDMRTPEGFRVVATSIQMGCSCYNFVYAETESHYKYMPVSSPEELEPLCKCIMDNYSEMIKTLHDIEYCGI
jgi:hypothetical protein